MQRMLHYALIFMTLAMMAGNIYAQKLIVIKFSYDNTSTSTKGLAVARFKQLAEEMTKGKVRVDIYPDGKLFKETDELEALQLNAVQMLAVPLGKFSKTGMREFELFGLPYLFPNEDALHRVTLGPIGRSILDKLSMENMTGLTIWDNGFKDMFTYKPVRTPNDMRGLKMQILSSDVLEVQMRSVDAIPISLNYRQLLEALKNRTVDGTENTPSNFYTPDIVGMPTYLTLTNHGYLGYAVVANKLFWSELPAEIRVQLGAAMKRTTVYANQIAQQENAATLAAIRKSGKTTVIELTDAEKRLWRTALFPVQKTMGNHVGKEWINLANKAASKPVQ